MTPPPKKKKGKIEKRLARGSHNPKSIMARTTTV